MGQITLGHKKILVNSDAAFPLTFWDANYNVVAPTAARYMRIEGFNTFDLNTIHNVDGYRGAAGFAQVFTSEAATYSGTSFAGPIPANTIVRLEFEFKAGLRNSGEYSRFMTYDGKTEVLQLLLQPGETVATFNAKLYNAIRSDVTSGLRELLNTPIPPALVGTFLPDGTATSIASLPIFCIDNNLSFTLKITSDNRSLPSPFVQLAPTAFNPIVNPSFIGRGNYDVLKNIFIDSYERMPYSMDRDITPVRGALYTYIKLHTIVARPDLGGGVAPDQITTTENRFEIYINESACLPYQNDIVDFLDLATVLSTINPVAYQAPEWYNAGAYLTPVPAVAATGFLGSPALAPIAAAAFKA